MVPIPQYPIYTATLTMLNASCIPYYLEEALNWGIDMQHLDTTHDSAISRGVEVRAIVVINPGNPTGAVLSVVDLEGLIKFASRKRLVIIADEVYQTNVFEGRFHSFKSVLRTMQKSEPGKYDYVELVSLHSISKGMVGECGQRGGYFELVGFDTAVVNQIYKVVSLPLCASIPGQCLVELMVNPPKPGEPSYARYKEESDAIFRQLDARAKSIHGAVVAMRGMSCATPQGSLYVFPAITLPEKAVDAANDQSLAVDEFYCKRLLNSTGICLATGSAFGQRRGTFHLRLTILPEGTDWIRRLMHFHNDFIEEFK